MIEKRNEGGFPPNILESRWIFKITSDSAIAIIINNKITKLFTAINPLVTKLHHSYFNYMEYWY